MQLKEAILRLVGIFITLLAGFVLWDRAHVWAGLIGINHYWLDAAWLILLILSFIQTCRFNELCEKEKE